MPTDADLDRRRHDNLDRAFTRIQEAFKVGGALAAADKAIADAQGLAALYDRAPAELRTFVHRELTAAIVAVQITRRPFDGADPSAPLTPSWSALRSAIRGLYVRAWSIQDNVPSDSTLLRVVKAATVELPSTLTYVPRVVGDAAKGATDATTDLLGKLVRELWPLLAGVALVGIVAAVVVARAGKAVPA